MHHMTYAIMEAVKRNDVALKDRAKAIEVCVAEMIASCLEIPTSPVAELQSYFFAHGKVKALEKLSEVNEHVVIDIDRACDLVYRIWKLRYCMVHRPNDPTVGRLVVNAVNTNSGQIPEAYREVIRKYPDVGLSRYQIEDAKEVEAIDG